MSSGPFTNTRYEGNSGDIIYPCRVQPETLGLSISSVLNAAPVASVTPGVGRIALRRGRRAFGPTIRTVTIKMTENGAGAVAYLKEGNTYVLPTMTKAFHDAIAFDATGTYQGVACKVVNKFPE